MELPVAAVQDVPSADGSAVEPCTLSDDAAAAAKVASRAQTEHAEHLQGLLRALQLPRGAVVPKPQPQRDGAAADGAAPPQLDSLLASLKQCRASLDEQQQRCTAEAEAEATLEVPAPVPARWSSSAGAGASSGASGGASSHEHAVGGELGLGGELGSRGELGAAAEEEAQDAVSLLEACFPAHLAQLFASESAALREMALGRLGGLLLSSDAGEAPAEAEVWEAGADEAEAAAAADEEEEEEGAAAPRFWARATLLSEDCEALGAGCSEAGSEASGEVPLTPPHAELRARSSPDARLLAACMAVREALLDDELRVRPHASLAAWHCCKFPPPPTPTPLPSPLPRRPPPPLPPPPPQVRLAALDLLDPHGALLSGLLPCCGRRAAREALPLLLSPLHGLLISRSGHEARSAADALLALAQHPSGGVALLRPHLLLPLRPQESELDGAARLRLIAELLRAIPPRGSRPASAAAMGGGRAATAQPSLARAATELATPAAPRSPSALVTAPGLPGLTASEVLPLCGQGLRAEAAPVRQAAVDLLLLLQQLGGEQRQVERWLSQQRLPQALQEDLERRVRARSASSPSSRPPGSSASRSLVGSSSRVGLVPPRTAGV